MPGVYIIIIAALLVLSALFSATETAFSTYSKTRMKTYAEYDDNKKAKLVLKLSENYDKLLSTILIGNNIVNIAMSSIATLLFIELLTGTSVGSEGSATISTAVITLLVLIFGEITPKSMAKCAPERFCLIVAPLLNLLVKLASPLSFLFVKWQGFTSRFIKVDEEESGMSQEELLMLVDEVEEEGTIDEGEVDLLRSAIEFNDRRAEDVLTHRTDLEGVDMTATKDKIAEKFATTKYSRLLVYNETIDNIVGVICLKDFFGQKGITETPVHELIGPVVFVQKTEKISDVLKLLQKGKTHVAVVLDNYGGTFGIITLEDILEELVGEIWDEHDEVTEHFSELAPDCIRVDASVNMDEFCRYFDVRIDTESALVATYVQEELDKLPEVGDSFDVLHLTLTVSELDRHRMTYVDVTVHEREDEDEDED